MNGTARDHLIELFEVGGPHPSFSIEEVVDIALAEHAHELAEKIRADKTGHCSPETQEYFAELIDEPLP